MTQIEIVDEPELVGTRRALVLTEDRVGHYPEFRNFFVRRFALDSAGLSRPGYVRAPSGMIYALVFIGRSGERRRNVLLDRRAQAESPPHGRREDAHEVRVELAQ